MNGPVGLHARTTVVVSAFVGGVEHIPIPNSPNRWVRPDRIEVRYERVGEGGDQGEMLYCSTTVSGMKVNGDDVVCSAAGAVTFSDNGPAWVNKFIVDNMPKPVTPVMRAIEVAYDLVGVAGSPNSVEAQPLTEVVRAMPEGMAYRTKGAAMLLEAVADAQWRREMAAVKPPRKG